VLAKSKGGTILFDEVTDIPSEVQARIVRMMDGNPDALPRFMATSQSDLNRAMDDGKLRQDLYYRLSGASIAVPALRDRVDDIPLLVDHFLARAEREGLPLRKLADDAMELVRSHPWPGNVRQLENAIRRLVLTARVDEISKAEVAAVLGSQPDSEPVAGGVEDNEMLSASIGRHLRRYFDLHGNMLPPPGLYARILKEMELPLLEIALEATGGNQAKCADLLGINRNTLRKKITDLDIRVTRRRKLM